MSTPRLQGQVALVTGAARGIGLAIARRLQSEGAQVVCTDRDAEALAASWSDDADAKTATLDVTDVEAWREVVSEHGPIDILVNNAGLMSLGPFLEQNPSRDAMQIAVNVQGVIHGMRAVLPSMKQRGAGYVVNVASAAGDTPFDGGAVYAATKHAVVGLTRSVRVEMLETGVHVGMVQPSAVETDLVAGTGRMRFPPLAQPEDVAHAVIRVILERRETLHVPRVASVGPRLVALMPVGMRDMLGKAVGIHNLSHDIDSTERAAYRARAFGEDS